MKSYLYKLATDYEKSEQWLASPEGEAGLKRLSGGKLKSGARCAWFFREDVDMWVQNKGSQHLKDWFYRGIIVPFPNTDGRSELEPEHCCVVVLEYPIEKENPQTDWATLTSILSLPDLYRFHIMAD